MKKVLVTGGCGFIGSHLVESLVRTGKTVTVLDSLQLNVGMLENLKSVVDDVRIVRGDIRDFNTVKQAVTNQDTVYHLAAISHLPYCRSNPLLAVETNFGGVVNILEACRISNVENVVYAGTDHIYGVTDKLPITEDSPYAPHDLYSLTKAHSIQLCKSYHRNYGVNVKVLISSNVFGERQDMSKAVPIFSVAAWKGKQIVVNGGKQTRDFYYVKNLVDAYLLVAEKGLPGESYNVSGRKEISVINLVSQITKLTHSRSDVKYDEYRNDETSQLRLKLDTTKIEKLGWVENIGFDEGLKKTVKWYRDGR